MNLIDTYVSEVGKELPKKMRADIETEIRSALQDMLEERSQKKGKSVNDEMIFEVLKEYGAPGNPQFAWTCASVDLPRNPGAGKKARSYTSKGMKSTKSFKIPTEIELRRIRFDRWRMAYVIEQDRSLVDVLAIRKRPPYQYDDLEELLQEI